MNFHYSALILAAGLGKRMHSDLPKVLHEICGYSLVEHVVFNLQEAGIDSIGVIVGHKHELIEDRLGASFDYYLQKEQLGTAHAVLQAKPFLSANKSHVLVLCGDAPLQDAEILKQFMQYCESKQLDLGVLSAALDDPANYGRIVRKDGLLSKIVEKKDCTPDELLIKEINSGTYCFNAEKLNECLHEISNNNVQNEYYLTDTVELFLKKGYKVDAYISDNADIIKAVNTPLQLHECEKIMRSFINRKHIENGVRMIDPETVYIDRNITIGKGTTIYPNTILTGNTDIGNDNTIISSRIDSSKIGKRNHIDTSTVESSKMNDHNTIGPYAHLRPDSDLNDHIKIGNFVEIKNAIIDENSKVSHLSYVGDGRVGKNVNLGCGIVFVNFDGKDKHQTIIEDDAFIGCNVNLVAPIKVGKNAYIAAGSTVTEDVKENALVIARSRAVTKPNWNKEHK